MGSVMTEVFHDSAQPWSSREARATSSPNQGPFDTSFHPSSQSPTQQASSHHGPSSTSDTVMHTMYPSMSSNSPSFHAHSNSQSARSAHATPSDPSHLQTKDATSPVAADATQTLKSQTAPPSSASFPATTTSQTASTTSPEQTSANTTPRRIAVQSLQHIQDIAGSDPRLFLSSPSAEDDGNAMVAPQYMISDMPVGDIIEMVAGLLTKITLSNDQHYDHLHRSLPLPDSTGMSMQTSSVLAFHGKNVPSITILSYLSRIQKYCPATYEVFLSLLVYFDRMTERVNAGHLVSLRQADLESQERHRSQPAQSDMTCTVTKSDSTSAEPTPPQDDVFHSKVGGQRPAPAQGPLAPREPPSPPLSDSDPASLSHFFVVDSFNIHRLVIAGVTCAAKFFSDVFFTNSRYAKVGGLPLIELNHLELQFLLLNDFRLAIPVEELDQYATMLVAFYAREIAAQRQMDAMEGVDGASMVTR